MASGPEPMSAKEESPPHPLLLFAVQPTSISKCSDARRARCQADGVGSRRQACPVYPKALLPSSLLTEPNSAQVIGGGPGMSWKACWSTNLMGPIPAWESYALLLGISLRGMGLLRDSWERFFFLIKERWQGETLCPMSLFSHSGNWALRVGCLEQLQPPSAMRRNLLIHGRGRAER